MKKLLPFTEIRIKVPRKFILRVLDQDNLSRRQYIKLRRKLAEIERVDNKLQHLRSLVEKAMLKY